jgi:hypothetical protein
MGACRFGDGRRVELERVQDDLDLVGVVEPLEGQVEVGEPDVAPGTDHVGPHVDAHVPSNVGVTRRCSRPPDDGR